MQCIKLPEFIVYEDYQRLAPSEREQYVVSKLKEILKLNKKRGVTIKQIEEDTYFHRNTLAYHLERLVAKGEIYKYPENTRNSRYYPNGNLADPILEEDIVLGDKMYSVYLMANQLGKFIYLQEKEVNVEGAIIVRGGIMIPYENREIFFRGIKEIEKLLENTEIAEVER